MKIIVFDDDPTGSQTVFGCPLLLKWDYETLDKGIKSPSPLLFLLTNTRALSANQAEARIRDICKLLRKILKANDLKLKDIYFISRGDSTLRGHWVLEPRILDEELGPFDATFHVPAFLEGGRTTFEDQHFLNSIPVHKTMFGKDTIFGYSTNHLPSLLEEKSNGQINSKDVVSISIEQLDMAKESERGMAKLIDHISSLSANQNVVVNACIHMHLNSFAEAIRRVKGKKNFLFRSAASFINSLSDISPESNINNDFSSLRLKDSLGNPKPGLVLVGSHVKLSGQQLDYLMQESSCIGVELPVQEIVRFKSGIISDEIIADLEKIWFDQLMRIIQMKKTPVLYTSRGELIFPSDYQRIEFGIFLAELMARLAAKLENYLGYIISKGGITTHILLSKGLKLSSVDLQGQILPGLSVVCSNRQGVRNLPILTFPGNLGDQTTLFKTWKMMDSY